MKWLSNVFKESLEQILKETKVNLGSVLRRWVSPKQTSKYFHLPHYLLLLLLSVPPQLVEQLVWQATTSLETTKTCYLSKNKFFQKTAPHVTNNWSFNTSYISQCSLHELGHEAEASRTTRRRTYSPLPPPTSAKKKLYNQPPSITWPSTSTSSFKSRPQRSIETIASFDLWSGTIENHWKRW